MEKQCLLLASHFQNILSFLVILKVTWLIISLPCLTPLTGHTLSRVTTELCFVTMGYKQRRLIWKIKMQIDRPEADTN